MCGQDGKEWYIMESAWIASWLAYVHFDTMNAPAPGPCRNDRLITWDYAQHKYVGRFGLFMAVSDRAGDYRRVSKETWEQFCAFYPGSGPAITMQFAADQANENGLYDTAAWTILDPPPAPENKDKKVKKKLFGGLGSKKKEKKAAEGDDEEKSGAEATTPGSSNDQMPLSAAPGSGAANSGGKYAILSKEQRESHGSEAGLLLDDGGGSPHDTAVRSSSVAAGNRPDSVSLNIA